MVTDFQYRFTEFNKSSSQEVECREGNQRADLGAVWHPPGHGPGELGGGPVLERVPWWKELVHQEDG